MIPTISHQSKSTKSDFTDADVKIESVAQAIAWSQSVRGALIGDHDSRNRLREIWFRGTRKPFPLCPGIYRSNIDRIANDVKWDDGRHVSKAERLEARRLALERDMMATFQRESGPLLKYESEQELYFIARHYGMPSRLLDWSISPFVALFMCVFPEPSRSPRYPDPATQLVTDPSEDGILYAMNPEALGDPCDQNHPDVKIAIEAVTAYQSNLEKPRILPVRPNPLPGRMDRQLSRFTLHCHLSAPVKITALRSVRVPREAKNAVRSQLEALGVNEFSVYYTLDRLTSDVMDRYDPPRS
jgi:hypothetical protein